MAPVEQIGLFDSLPGWLEGLPENADNPYGLRYYQREAVDAVFEAFGRGVPSVLLEAATGTGKTRTFGAIAGMWEGRVLVLAHRDELVQQAAKALESLTGERVGIEQGPMRSGYERIVIGSTQSVFQKKRLKELMAKGGFGLVVCDEAHRYVAKAFRRPVDTFREHNDAKVLGVTATPDRTDKRALGLIFEECVYRYPILKGVEDGYLVPLESRRVFIDQIDLSGFKAKDFTDAKLDEMMVRAVEGITRAIIDRWPDHKGPLFFPGKHSSRYAAERLNALKPGCAAAIADDTPQLERRRIVRDVRQGNIQFLCNFGIVTEGWDWPDANFVGLGRPTKSRLVYAQMVGRGTRVLPNLVDTLPSPEQRRAAIAASAKPHVVIADFVGNSGKHDLAQVEDVLGGRYSEPEIKEAKKRAQKAGGGDPMDHLEEARRHLQKMAEAAKKVKSEVKHRVVAFNAFDTFHIDIDKETAVPSKYDKKPASKGQLNALRAWGVDEKDMDKLSHRQASKLIGTCIKRKELGLASYRKLRQLRRFGITNANISDKRASAAMRYLQSKGWGKSGAVDPDKLRAILDHKKE